MVKVLKPEEADLLFKPSTFQFAVVAEALAAHIGSVCAMGERQYPLTVSLENAIKDLRIRLKNPNYKGEFIPAIMKCYENDWIIKWTDSGSGFTMEPNPRRNDYD